MRPDLVEVLRCPVCGAGLVLTDRTARCPRQHAYDLAKQGYLNLLPTTSKGIEGDTAEMVAARADFLAAGHYAPIRDALAAAATGTGLVVEVGAGTAYYLEGVTRYRSGIALDVSRYAARRAAKVAPHIGSVVCDAWRELPLQDNSTDLILNVFAPRNATEMARILSPTGTLLVVTPNQTHLAELVTTLDLLTVDTTKDQRLHDSLAGKFDHHSSTRIEHTLTLDHQAVEHLITMTPSAHHLDRSAIQARVARLPDRLDVQLAVTLSAWRPT